MSDENTYGTSRLAVFQLESEGVTNRRRQTMQAGSFLGSLSPLINSMRLFGLYFTRRPGRSNSSGEGGTTIRVSRQLVAGCEDWSFARIYATIMLVVTSLNAVRQLLIFDGKETIGAALFMKLALIPAVLLNVVLHATYYVASHTGSLQRVFVQADLSMTKLITKYSCRAKVVTVLCWLFVAWNMFHYTYQLFFGGRLKDLTIILLENALPEPYMYVVKAVLIVVQLHTFAVWFFPLAMNYMVMTCLCDQFDALNNEFSRCIGERRQFDGDFGQFRQRHQIVSRSVQEADRFLMISNGASFCCEVITIILVLYSTIFYRDNTISLDPESTFLYIAWLGFSVFGLALAAGQAIMVNHMASISIIHLFYLS